MRSAYCRASPAARNVRGAIRQEVAANAGQAANAALLAQRLAVALLRSWAEPDVEHGRLPSPFLSESKERANDLALFFRHTIKEAFFQMALVE